MAEATIPFRVYNLTLTGGWDAFEIPNEVNTLLCQARTNVAVQVSHSSTGSEYFTIKSQYGLVQGSFNCGNQTLYFKGSAGVVVEIITVNRP